LQFDGKEGYTRGIAARPVQTGDKARLHGIATHHENERNAASGVLGRQSRNRASACIENSDAPIDQLIRKSRQAIVIAIRPAIFDDDVATFVETGFAQAFPKGGHHLGIWRLRSAVEKADHRCGRRLLRVRGMR
jgi:hypothetical protein